MNKTCDHDYKNAIRKGRAHYVCPLCGKDISLILILMEEAKDKYLGLGYSDEQREKMK
jgi:hypothetical protein